MSYQRTMRKLKNRTSGSPTFKKLKTRPPFYFSFSSNQQQKNEERKTMEALHISPSKSNQKSPKSLIPHIPRWPVPQLTLSVPFLGQSPNTQDLHIIQNQPGNPFAGSLQRRQWRKRRRPLASRILWKL